MKHDIKIIKKEDKEFPAKLKELSKCPKELYAIGNIELLKSEAIAIVGSRNASDYGLKMADKFARELSRKGITIISGMAIRNRYCST
jgi:DNA processing protein